MKNKLRLIMLATLFHATSSWAMPMDYTFTITAVEGSAVGTFTGTDGNADDMLVASEIDAFTVIASGTGFTGGPYSLSLPTATLAMFAFDVLNATITVLEVFGPNSINMAWADNSFELNTNPGFVHYEVGNSPGSWAGESSAEVSQSVAANSVPLPSSLALAFIGMLALGAGRRRHQTRG